MARRNLTDCEFPEARERLIEEIQRDVRETVEFTGRAVLKPSVYEALRRVNRERFVLPSMKQSAYANSALPIDCDQTISQPYIVALMTDMLEIDKDSVVLEVGTGSGYQTAVLAEIAKQVYSIEAVKELSQEARERLRELGYDNIEFRQGNGRKGWPAHSPYDAIIVTAATDTIPPALVKQLKPGGHIAIPVGGPWRQELIDVTRDESGETKTRYVLPVAFVPLTGKD